MMTRYSLHRLFFVSLFLITIDAILLKAQSQHMFSDTSMTFLQGDAADATIAITAPIIDFGIIDVSSNDEFFTHWCNVVLGPDSRYYFTIGNHDRDGVVMLIAYDPAEKTYDICIDSRNISGLADGKWHGRPVINPDSGDMYLIGFYNGDIVCYNIYSKHTENLGPPVADQGFEEHIWDWQRDRLYGMGSRGDLLVYDTEKRSVIFHGAPQDSQTGFDFNWEYRSRLLDRESGILYGSDNLDFTMLNYNPASNSFHAMKSWLNNSLRASSNIKEEDGSFWIFDRIGNVYKFFPDEDQLVDCCTNWDRGAYVTFIERSPGGRYLYYSLAQARSGMPVIQYDTRTNEKKVLAFLEEYYSEKYDFIPTEFYGGALSKDGSSLFLVCNSLNSNPGMFHIYIPQSERNGETTAEVNSDATSHPANFKLEQNFPNPFNPKTMIRYTVGTWHAVSVHVNLSIYNLLGQKVVTLVNKKQPSGSYQVQWNASGFASGIYIYQLKSKSQKQNALFAKKLVLLK